MCGGSRSVKPTTRTANKSPGSRTQTGVIKMSTPMGVATGETVSYYTAASLSKASLGTFFWCNGTLSNCMNSSDPRPCFVVTVVPRLTLYGELELAWLLPPSHPWTRRAAFLPIMLGVSIDASIDLTGALGNSLVTAQYFNDKLQLALESTTASF
ncbi:PREDICTED: endogenous retrovirus group FC1 member 1 Env polyprotein-like [Myotis brandtii]|uniref:endogenous retrovirus group FC1 member 1 Env polyprotein-like n=1 Tax=Myotis brandtii TaxID=109478 RepID=UPI000704685F|nr:PREDICTED: endogenous retrovirus group FC1 member 1 Env polyprotein-like [Myotis brandtii]